MSELKRIEYYDDRFYKIETESDKGPVIDYLESVTTVLGAYPKPFLARWRGEVGNREADLRMREGQDKGTNIHEACRLLTQGFKVVHVPKNQVVPAPEEGVIVVKSQEEYLAIYRFFQWIKAVKPKILASEMTVYSMAEHAAGTMDYLFEIEEGEYLIDGKKPIKLEKGIYLADLKSGAQVDDDAYLQVGTYANFYEEMFDDLTEDFQEIKGTLIIHTGASTKTGIAGLSTHVRNREDLMKDYEDFKSVHKVWKRKNAGLEPKTYDFPQELSLV